MVLDQVRPEDIPLVFLAGALAFLGYVGSRVMKKFGIPTTAGFILSGMILGNIFIHTYFPDFPKQFRILSDFALGLIGLQIGTELDLSHVRKYFRNLTPLLLVETLGTFMIVTVVMSTWFTSIHLGILFGAIAAATAPAVTVRIIMETKAEGPLTRTVYFLLASDDLVALVIAASVLELALEPWMEAAFQVTLNESIMLTITELFWTIVAGIVLGFIFDYISERENDLEDLIALVIAVMLILVGFSEFVRANVILASMIIGIIHSNWGQGKREEVVEKIENITMPIVVFFFILVGIDFDVSLITHSLQLPGFQEWQFTLVLVVIVYTLTRTIAKIITGYLGAVAGKVPREVKENVGFTLLSQGGVALGISFLIFERLSDAGNADLGLFILSVLAVSTVITELIGVFAAKFALKRANEIPSEEELELERTQPLVIDSHWIHTSKRIANFISEKIGNDAISSIFWAPNPRIYHKEANLLVVLSKRIDQKMKKEIISDVMLFDDRVVIEFIEPSHSTIELDLDDGWHHHFP